MRRGLAILLSLCLGLFLADAVVSFADDTLIVFFKIHALTGLRGMVFLCLLPMTLLVYGLMGLTPMIPKRLFLPVTLFGPLSALLTLPLLVYYYARIREFAWMISLAQLGCALLLLRWSQGGLQCRWPLVPQDRLGARSFGWLNLTGFALLNALVFLPAVAAYLALCAVLAVNHFSDGFLALRPGGLSVQVRDYVRPDGKTLQLVPMAHIGEPDFYRQLAQSFPTNAIILREGVTDNEHLLTNKISYRRMANSLRLVEQQKEFQPTRGQQVPADVDTAEFSASTVEILNLAMRVHAKGFDSATAWELIHYSPSPQVEARLFDDLLAHRNRHLIQELQAHLAQSEHFIVPWGAAHMPGIAREIQKSGFVLKATREYMAIRFSSLGKQGRRTRPGVRD